MRDCSAQGRHPEEAPELMGTLEKNGCVPCFAELGSRAVGLHSGRLIRDCDFFVPLFQITALNLETQLHPDIAVKHP